MRFALLLAATAAPLSVGCTAIIARSGEDLSALKTREQVHDSFGTPVATGTSDGQTYEEYRSRRKIAEPHGPGYAMSLALTLGLTELYWFPRELYLLGRHTILGRDICFTYDAAGNVTAVHIDHMHIPWLSNPLPTYAREESASPEGEKPQ